KKIPAKLIENSNKADGLIELTNGGEISFFSGENPDQVRGHSFHKVIIDEAAMIPNLEDIWHGDIEPTLLEYSGKALIISTPKGRNFFYQLFKRGENGEAGIESFHYPSSSNPYLPKKWLEDRRKTIPEARFREEYQAIPGENSGNPFSQIDVLANTIEELSNKPSVIYGIDLAKTVDYSVIVGLDEDGSMSYFDRWQTSHTDNMERIKRLPKDAPKIIDSTGAGDAIYEMLKYKVYNLVPFVFTQASKPRIMLELIKDVQNHNIKFNKMTADEMMVFEHYETQTGHIKYEAMAGCHDDCIMALAMANFYKAKAFNILNWKLYTV
ncbi:MAG: terminase family protein, partial [Filimonas sp.]|nr:terminase family protein [Filimonas sp.]